ncbi:flagellar hook-basal body complex protein FliE [Erythrobacter sp.]|uniref:flagellar hook-basal body complex protein FliE n=1 Tax=Erythrobacter sp. TaxID=1042 RepID=UPI00311EC447
MNGAGPVGGSLGSIQQVMALRQEVLSRSTALRDVREAGGAEKPANRTVQAGGFADALNGALHQVSAVQAHSSDMQAAYERGEVTDIAKVMLARQEAGVAFEATLQVRNKLLAAYQETMRMGV